MDKLRKMSVCFYGSAALLAFICFFVSFGAGVNVSILGMTGTASVYDLTFGDGMEGGVLTAWIFLLIAFICFAGAIALKYTVKEELCNLGTSALGSLFALVSGILYFCTSAFVGGGSLGAGAIFDGILLILAAIVGCVPLCLKLIKK